MKKAILIICFGNKNVDEEVKKLKEKIVKSFYNYDIYVCFTSSFFIKKYGYNLYDILDNLYTQGYEDILCLSLFTIDGIEYEKTLFCINKYKTKFKRIKISSPLLHNETGFFDIYNFIKNNYDDDNLIYICHGTDDKSDYKYKKLFSMFKDENLFFANLESIPYIEDTIKILNKKNINSVCIKPFLLFNGKHIQKDISYNIKNKLIDNNINVTLRLKPLLQYDEIVDIFIKRLMESKEI
ncbi:sirohydrochlorin cobaltochelatase [uncultured Tyzzerella sp.]|uniref:sirohydrochlorin cobaltochelatase n=1 Tax=uncultured Tyzzerella sp. TaxID=2321398 RepID=UPI002942F10A|nr:sirohydrochlorin cobaltochelatase [uncultured Tyzzerella sp.]